jgi:hypothetical protein
MYVNMRKISDIKNPLGIRHLEVYAESEQKEY